MPIMSLHHIKWLGISSIYFNDEKERHFVLKTIFSIIHENIESSKKIYYETVFAYRHDLCVHISLYWNAQVWRPLVNIKNILVVIFLFPYSFGLYDEIRCDIK